MFDILDRNPQTPTPEEAHQLLQELERSTSDEIRRQRSHFRLAIKAALVIQSGNSSDLLSFKVKAVSGDISEGGCSVLTPLPIRVGDIYRLAFDQKTLDLPMMFARCMRCRLVREDAFEAGFAFFSPITLPETLCTAASDASAR